jgi:hypothetical protein
MHAVSAPRTVYFCQFCAAAVQIVENPINAHVTMPGNRSGFRL